MLELLDEGASLEISDVNVRQNLVCAHLISRGLYQNLVWFSEHVQIPLVCFIHVFFIFRHRVMLAAIAACKPMMC